MEDERALTPRTSFATAPMLAQSTLDGAVERVERYSVDLDASLSVGLPECARTIVRVGRLSTAPTRQFGWHVRGGNGTAVVGRTTASVTNGLLSCLGNLATGPGPG